MNILAIIQARMRSTRLPGKVLKRINGRPMLWYVLNRLKQSKYINQIVVATSTDKSDDILAKYCLDNQINIFRGSLNNVLERYYKAAIRYKADIIIRITADCPLVDSKLIDSGIVHFLKGKYDYITNKNEPEYIRGFEFEVFNFETLKICINKSKFKFEKEHVTPYIWNNISKKFRTYHYKYTLEKPFYRFTIDTKLDYKLINLLISKYHAHLLNYYQILKLIKIHPKLQKINSYIKQKKYDISN